MNKEVNYNLGNKTLREQGSQSNLNYLRTQALVNKSNYTKVLIDSKLVHSTISHEQVKQRVLCESIEWSKHK